MKEKSIYLPPENGLIPDTLFVTDRVPSAIFGLLNVSKTDITRKAKVTILGSGVYYPFEKEIARTGATLSVIDPSLACTYPHYSATVGTSQDITTSVLFSRGQQQVAGMNYLSESEFQKLQQERWNTISKIAQVISAQALPSINFYNTIEEQDWFFDCFGPASYLLGMRELYSYILSTSNKLTSKGKLVIFPTHTARDVFTVISSSLPNLKFETYSVSTGSELGTGVHISKKS